MTWYLDNKYSNWYFCIIENAKNTVVSGEKHHIMPRALGGNDDSYNLVKLTSRQHFVCHLLLVKMVEGLDRSKMAFAVRMMTNTRQQKVSSRIYEIVRREHSEAIRALRLGSKHSDETKARISLSMSGKNAGKRLSDSHRMKISKALQANADALKQRKPSCTGTTWFNNGTINKRSTDCPIGWVKGRLV